MSDEQDFSGVGLHFRTDSMDWIFDDPSPSHTTQPSLPTQQHDQAVKAIYEYLTDFSSFQPSNSTSTSTSTALVDRYQQSTTVNPPCTFPGERSLVSSESGQSSQERPDVVDSKIQIEKQPREKFRPRTEKESLGASHYLRSKESGYPTIKIPQSWRSRKSFVKVTLVDKEKNPHPYIIDNKDRQKSSLIFKSNEPNSLCFHITDEDLAQGQKMFLIEFIKPKQSDTITKELIQVRKLNQSMLCFQRYYQTDEQDYQLDESSTEYSSLMTEDFGSIHVEDVFPLYGPMSGNSKVAIEFKGILSKDRKRDIQIRVLSQQFRLQHQITSIKKNGNCFSFCMPNFPVENIRRAKVTILVSWKEETLYQGEYLYMQTLDEELNSDYAQSTCSNKRLRQEV